MTRHEIGSGWLLVDGIVTLLLAFTILGTWPSSKIWAIGDVGWREHAVQRHQPLRSSVIGSISREDFALIAAQVNLTDRPAAWLPDETQDPPALRFDRRASAMRLSI